MKKATVLTSIFLTSVLVGCGQYASRTQAEVACDEWMDKGELIEYIAHFGTGNGTQEWYVSDRVCELEEATNQFLGLQGELSREHRELEGERVYYKDKLKPENLKVVKNFRY